LDQHTGCGDEFEPFYHHLRLANSIVSHRANMGLIHSKADAAPPPMPNFLASGSPVVKAAIDDLKASLHASPLSRKEVPVLTMVALRRVQRSIT
jgi:hypothetical protein